MTEQLPPDKHTPFRDALVIVAIAGVFASLLEIVAPSSGSFEVFISLLVFFFGYSILDQVWGEK